MTRESRGLAGRDADPPYSRDVRVTYRLADSFSARGHQSSLLRSRVYHEFRDFIILEGGRGGGRGEGW